MPSDPDEFIPLREVIQAAYPNRDSPIKISQISRERILRYLREGRINAVARFREFDLIAPLTAKYWDRIGDDLMAQVLILKNDPHRQGDFEITLSDALANQSEEELARAALTIRGATGLKSIGPLSALIRHADHVGHVGVLASEWSGNSINPKNRLAPEASIPITREPGKPTSRGWKVAFRELVRMIDSIESETGKNLTSNLAKDLYRAVLLRTAITSNQRQDILSVKTLMAEIAAARSDDPLPSLLEIDAEKSLN